MTEARAEDFKGRACRLESTRRRGPTSPNLCPKDKGSIRSGRGENQMEQPVSELLRVALMLHCRCVQIVQRSQAIQDVDHPCNNGDLQGD